MKVAKWGRILRLANNSGSLQRENFSGASGMTLTTPPLVLPLEELLLTHVHERRVEDRYGHSPCHLICLVLEKSVVTSPGLLAGRACNTSAVAPATMGVLKEVPNLPRVAARIGGYNSFSGAAKVTTPEP